MRPAARRLNRALEIAEAAGATALIPRILCKIAHGAFLRGEVEEGFAALERGWALARAAQEGPATGVAGRSTKAMRCSSSRSSSAPPMWRRAVLTTPGRPACSPGGWPAYLVANAAEALLALGRTAEAAALIDPLTTMPSDRAHWNVQAARAEIDLLRGDTGAAAERWQLIYAAFPVVISRVDFAYESAPRAAEALLWAGRPGDALRETRRALARSRART